MTGVIVGAGNHSTVRQVSDDRIDFISSYCDRWCERCAYTERCSAFISAQIHRAVDGRDRFEHDEEPFEDDPVQNDWNGSAKWRWSRWSGPKPHGRR